MKIIKNKRGMQQLPSSDYPSLKHSRKIPVILISALLIIASGVAGYFIGKSSQKDIPGDYQKIIDQLFPEPPKEIFAVSGTIEKISENSVTIRTPKPGKRFLPGEEIEYLELQIDIGSNTQIYETNIFRPGEEKQISLSELKEGETITAESDENIIGKSKITGSKILKVIIDTI